ncbi:MAG: hypothetical protein ABR589_05240, partial [Chthoniobacterales bacterium]
MKDLAALRTAIALLPLLFVGTASADILTRTIRSADHPLVIEVPNRDDVVRILNFIQDRPSFKQYPDGGVQVFIGALEVATDGGAPVTVMQPSYAGQSDGRRNFVISGPAIIMV